MSSLIDRREFKHPYGWAPEKVRPWKDFALTLLFAALGLGVTAFTIAMHIPIGEYVLWNN